jgi:hypothetical protein
MVGGTYHDHSDMETILGLGSLGAATEPITDAAMDLITTVSEGYADAMIRGRTGRTLANASSAAVWPCKSLLISMSMKIFHAQQGHRAGVTSRSSPDGASSYVVSLADVSLEIEGLIGLASSGTAPYKAVSTVDETDLSGG